MSILLAPAVALLSLSAVQAPPTVLTNHLGYERTGPKRAVIQGHPGDTVSAFTVEDADSGDGVLSGTPQHVGPVARWRDWVYWTADFSALDREGTYRLVATT